MTAVVYPSSLPAPLRWVGVPRERRRVSALPGRTQLAARGRDRITDIEAEWVYSAAQTQIWRAWYEDTLRLGLYWFAVECPGAGGWISRVCRFRTDTKRLEYLGNGFFRLSIRLEQRGRSVAPQRYSLGYVLASPPYPLIAREEMDAGALVLDAGRLGDTIDEDWLDASSTTLLAGELLTVLRTLSTGEDAFESPLAPPTFDDLDAAALQLLSGELHQILRTYTAPYEDGLDAAAPQLLSGELLTLLISYTHPAEDALDAASVQLISGVLT